MSYSPTIGEVADSTWRAQAISAFGGDYIIDGCQTSLGNSTTNVETIVDSGVINADGDPVVVDQQTVTHPDGPAPGGGPNGEDEGRVDLVTIDTTGSASRMVGTPMVPRDDDGNTTSRQFPNVTQPVPPTPTPSDDVIASAALVVTAGTGASSEMFADAVVPRVVAGNALNDLDLIPGRDIQYRIDNARKGEELVGDRSQQIVLDQPLTVGTQGVTLRNVNVQYADGAASNNSDDMITLAADGASVENATLGGNMGGQNADADGITVKASDCAIRDIEANAIGGHTVNLNGTSTAVNNTLVEDVVARDCNKAAFVAQGPGVFRATAQSIYSFNGGGAAARLRNAATWVGLDDVYAKNQGAALMVEDFGGANQGIVACTANNVRAADCNRLVYNNTSGNTTHRGLILTGLYGRDFTPGVGNGIINLQNINGVRIARSFIADNYDGAYAVYAEGASEIGIANSTFKNGSPDRGAIGLFDTSVAHVKDNIIRPHPNASSMGRGINVSATNGNQNNFALVTGNTVGGDTTTPIRVYEDGSTDSKTRNFIIKNNFADSVSNETAAPSGTYIVKDNI